MSIQRGGLPSRVGPPKSKVDVPGILGQFLSDLAPTDLVVELVQNDLDAGATTTRIVFGADAFTSEGDGASIDGNGWTRLEYVLGAGGEIEAKKDGIGSKNHGLRSAFLLSDEIGIQSGGLRVDLTTRGLEAHPTRFSPAAWDRSEDATGPTKGTRITAPYRATRIQKPDGDGNFLEPPTPPELDELWAESVREAPERFICASAPGKPWQYELALARHGHPTRTFVFECKPLTGALRGIFMRTCKLKVEGRPPRVILRRHCARFLIDPADLGAGKVPRLFRTGRDIYGEISWLVDVRGRPQPSTGLLRYPIAFPPESALTGSGFDIAAPFTAGRARHSLSDDPRNRLMVDAGRRAFARLAGARLAKAYGPGLGVLVASTDRPDEPRANDMARQLLEAGGLSVIQRTGNAGARLGSTAMAPAVRLTLAASLRSPGKLDVRLSNLAASGQVLHPDTPPDLVRRLAETCTSDLDWFDEAAAARHAFIEGIKADARVSERQMDICVEALRALEGLRRTGGIPQTLVAELRKEGRLPTSDGVARSWSVVRRSERPAPSIPGISDPPIAHTALMQATVLRTRPLRLPAFDLNEFVGTKDFSNVIPAGRQRFFTWLRANAGGLRTATLKAVADYPIWPGVDGEHRELDYYCRPRARALNELLGLVKVEPSRETTALVSSKAARGAWKLREQPRTDELQDWYASTALEVERLHDGGDAKAAEIALRRLEDALELLHKRGDVPIDEVAEGHMTFSQAGSLERTDALHAPTSIVVACGLPASALCRSRHLPLYELLGAHQRPTRGALIQALRSDPDQSRLFIRLEEYRRGGHDLGDLAAEPIIRTGSTLHAAEDLAFRAEPDLWGAWKFKLDRTSDVAEHHGLLAALGVTPASLKGGLSKAFFSWLGRQPREIQREHLPQILRHWRDRIHGPLQWTAQGDPIPSVPVHGKGLNFELVTLSEATNPRRSVFLDDFPGIREAALLDGKLRLTHHVIGTQGSVLHELDSAGVPSLRRAAGQPASISVVGGLETPADLTRELAHLQSGPVRSRLKARLPTFGVPLSDIKADIQKLIKDLKGARVGHKLLAVYTVAGRSFEVPVASGIDPQAALVCVAADADRLTDFYEALAGHLFKSGSSQLNAWGLIRAARDKRNPTLFEIEEIEDEDEDDGADAGGATSDGGGQLHKGHGAKVESLTPVVPEPKPLARISNPTFLAKPKKRPGKGTHGASTDGLRNSVEEEEQIRALKEEHYAWHCQACIGERDVLKVAPPGTYVFSPGYRRRMLHAHHAQHLQNQGGLGGRNLLILCSYHHDLWGDHLSRDKVLAALDPATDAIRGFPRDIEGKDVERRRGIVASIELDIEPFVAKLYFTKLHADAWRS